MFVSTVRVARISRRIHLYQLAAAAGINPVRLSRIEHLHVTPSAKERAALARALGMTEAELFREEGPAADRRKVEGEP